MSNSEPTRVMSSPPLPMGERTLVGGMGATQQMPAGGVGDAFRTQMGGTTTCPVCRSTTPLLDPYCGDCGFLLESAPAEPIETPVEEPPAAELVDLQDGRRFRLHSGVNTLGRQGTDILVNEGTVSRVHAKITLAGDALTIEDLGSSNGTKVGDLKIGPNQPTPANFRTPLRFGNWRVTVENSTGLSGQPADRTVLVADSAVNDRTLVGVPLEPSTSDTMSATATTLGPEIVALFKKIAGPAEDLPITFGTITLGRRAGNDVILTGDAFLSGRHADIVTDSTGTYLIDVGSSNGTVVNGRRLVVNERQLLLEGDEIQLGQTRYTFILLEHAPSLESVSDGAPSETGPLTTPESEAESSPESSDDAVRNLIGDAMDADYQETTAKFERDELVRGWREFEARTPCVVPLLKYAAKTDMGQVRENNEDKFDYYEPEAPGILAARGSLFAVADGIGGAQAGQIASEMMLKHVIAGYYDHPAADVETALHAAIVDTNDRIHSLAQMIPERSGMGTTLTAAIFVERRVVVALVGDSRAYLMRDGQIRQVTQDHSWVEEQVRAGLMTQAEAETSPFRNVITRSIGASPTVLPDFYEEEARIGDIWVLCSDGLTGYVNEQEIGQIAGSNAPSEAARQFIELANARGGRDNITVFVLSVRDLVSSDAAPTTQVGAAHYSRAAIAPITESPAPATFAVTPTPVVPETQRAGWRKLFGI